MSRLENGSAHGAGAGAGAVERATDVTTNSVRAAALLFSRNFDRIVRDIHATYIENNPAKKLADGPVQGCPYAYKKLEYGPLELEELPRYLLSIETKKKLRLPDGDYQWVVEPSHGSWVHGPLHATRVMLYVPMLVALYRDVLKDPAAAELTDADVSLLSLVALMHDIGRMGDGVDKWEEQSYLTCWAYLVYELGLDIDSANQFASAIKCHDNCESIKDPKLQLFARVINDADSLDIMRVRPKFNANYLECFKVAIATNNDQAKGDIARLCKEIQRLLSIHNNCMTRRIIIPGVADYVVSTAFNFKQMRKAGYQSDRSRKNGIGSGYIDRLLASSKGVYFRGRKILRHAPSIAFNIKVSVRSYKYARAQKAIEYKHYLLGKGMGCSKLVKLQACEALLELLDGEWARDNVLLPSNGDRERYIAALAQSSMFKGDSDLWAAINKAGRCFSQAELRQPKQAMRNLIDDCLRCVCQPKNENAVKLG